MRKPIVVALIIVLVPTIIVVGLHYLVQSFLPPYAINFLFIFLLALVAVIGVLAGFPDIVDRLSGKSRAELDETQKSRNRRNMLQLVWNTWIEGVLKKSLYNEVLIELGMETKPDAIEHPWDMVIQMPDKEPAKVPSDTTMLELFDQTSRSLLILGEPGLGKTTMLLELCRQAIEQAQEDPSQPIPVMFNLSSWTPKQTIAEWLVSELFDKYYVSRKISLHWIEEDALLPLLDGLDEIRTENRGACVEAINVFRAEYNIHLAVCSRQYEYEALKTRLKLRGAVLIQPMNSQQISKYLEETRADIPMISKVMQQYPELHLFTQSPLMLNILVIVSHAYKYEDFRLLGEISDYRMRLLDFYITQMFQRRGTRQTFPPEKTLMWLTWFARSVMEQSQIIFFIEDIKFSWLPISQRKIELIFRLIFGLILGMTFGVIVGLTSELALGLIWGVIAWLNFGLIMPFYFWRSEINPTDKLTWSWKNVLKPFILGVIGGLIFGVMMAMIGELRNGLVGGGDMLGAALKTGLKNGLIAGLIAGLSLGLFQGITGASIEERRNPGEGISSSLQNSLISGLVVGIIIGVIVGVIAELDIELNDGYELVYGLSNGLFAGLTIWMFNGGYFLITHYTTRWLLYRSGSIPWEIIEFLDYCTECIFLRKVGGGYIFIHRMLMEHFAEMQFEAEEE